MIAIEGENVRQVTRVVIEDSPRQSRRAIHLANGVTDLVWLGASFGLSALGMMALVTARGSLHAPTGRARL